MAKAARRVALVALLVALMAVSFGPAAWAQEGFQLTILHTNDTHAHLEPFQPFGEDVQGGVARRYTLIQQIRDEVPNVLLLDAGDAFQGTLFFNKWQGEEASHFMNRLGYQAMAVGNHEFDSGPGPLGSFARAAQFPVLSANLDVSAENEISGDIKPYAVLSVGGERIGVIGATTPEVTYISSPGPNVNILDPVASISSAVKALSDQGINKIVLLSHMGYPEDLNLLKSVGGIDVVVSGHSHTLLGLMESAAGSYPTVVTAADGAKTLVVSAQDWGRYLGRLDVTFDAEGSVASYSGAPIPVTEDIVPDAAVAAEVAHFAQPIDALRTKVIGSSAVDLEGTRALVRTQETNLGNLIADAMLWATEAQGSQIAIQNGGGIRASIPAGSVTMGQVLEVLPFGNQIATFGLTGVDVWAALENGVAKVEDAKGQFPQVGGLRFSYDPTQPSGSRVTSVQVLGEDGNYSDIVMDAVYNVVSNDFMRGGGDGYTMFAENAINAYDAGAILADAVAEYIGTMSPVSPEVEGRILAGETLAASASAPDAAPVESVVLPMTNMAAGAIMGDRGGAFGKHTVTFDSDTDAAITLTYWPDNPAIDDGVGLSVYEPDGKVAAGRYEGVHSSRTARFEAEAGVEYLVVVHNYVHGQAIGYVLEK